MTAYHVLEFLIVGGAVAFSGWNLAKRFMPAKPGTSAGGCSNCDSCGSCETPKPAEKREQPVHFHR